MAIIFSLVIISVLWAFWSLQSLKKRTESEKAKQELAKSRVVFYSPSDGASSQPKTSEVSTTTP